MNKKTLIITVSVFGALFVSFVTVILVFRDVVSGYAAIVSSISAFLYLTFNSIVVLMNFSNINASQKPYLIIAFETFAQGKGHFTLRNIGSVAAIVRSFNINSEWLEQFFAHSPEITEAEKKFLRELKKTHIIVSPHSRVVIKPVIEPRKIIDGQYPNEVNIKVMYTNTNKQKYEKEVLFDFTQYNEMIEYHADDQKSIGSTVGRSVYK